MKTLRQIAWPVVTACTLLVGLGGLVYADPPQAPPREVAPEDNPIDVVICLDVSGSMNGLIDSAKLQLWNIVLELSRLKPTPKLRVGLYSYGASHYDRDKGWVRKEVDLTEDLDEVYGALFGLRTGGGEEYVARVTKAALEEQKWSKHRHALRLIFVCGNEPVHQDPAVSLTDVAALAKKQDIIVNTIYCKYGRDHEIPAWESFATACNGRHTNIDQNRALRLEVVKTEYDEQILRLGEQLNQTYVAYGQTGRSRLENQLRQDLNAKAAGAPGAVPQAAIERSVVKATDLYQNAHWDLVDRMRNDKNFDIKQLKEEELPAELRALKPEERLDYLNKKAEQRAALQKQIQELNAKRQKKIAEEMAKRAKNDGEKAFDEALKAIIREQAQAKGFRVAQ
jgi:hypothetical protein